MLWGSAGRFTARELHHPAFDHEHFLPERVFLEDDIVRETARKDSERQRKGKEAQPLKGQGNAGTADRRFQRHERTRKRKRCRLCLMVSQGLRLQVQADPCDDLLLHPVEDWDLPHRPHVPVGSGKD